MSAALDDASLPDYLVRAGLLDDARGAAVTPAGDGNINWVRRVRDAIVGLLSDLVGIESVNPSLVAGGAGEGAIAAFVTAAGIPTVLFGPGEGAHEHEEWVSIADTELVARTLIRVAQGACE